MDHTQLSDAETDSDEEPVQPKIRFRAKTSSKQNNTLELKGIDSSSQGSIDAETLRKNAKEYQEKMKQIQIPYGKREQPIIYTSWEAVGRRLKQKYEQPLHYLTQKLLKQWDEWKPITPANEMTSFEGMMLPYDAEAVVLGIEQVHRKFTCPEFLAKCWAHDPLYLDNV